MRKIPAEFNGDFSLDNMVSPETRQGITGWNPGPGKTVFLIC